MTTEVRKPVRKFFDVTGKECTREAHTLVSHLILLMGYQKSKWIQSHIQVFQCL